MTFAQIEEILDERIKDREELEIKDKALTAKLEELKQESQRGE